LIREEVPAFLYLVDEKEHIMDTKSNPVEAAKMPDPVEVNFSEVEQKSIGELLAKADAGDIEAAETLRKMRAEVKIPDPVDLPIEVPPGFRDEDAQAVVPKVVEVPVEPTPEPHTFMARVETALSKVMGILTSAPKQPELPQQPIALQVEHVAETAVIPEAPPRVVEKPTVPIRIQKRIARNGTEVYRVHREGDPFYFWTTVYARASSFAHSLYRPDCYFVEA